MQNGRRRYNHRFFLVLQRFGIVHFAGPVFYDVEGFLEKNKDTFNHDLLDVINSSTNGFLKELFEKRLSAVS